MLTRLLPSRIAPMSRSRSSVRSSTIFARLFPSSARRCMRARDAAVSAVSEPEKKPEKSSSNTMAPRMTPRPSETISGGLPLPQQGPKLVGVDIAGDEGLAYSPRENEGEGAVDDFLVLSH